MPHCPFCARDISFMAAAFGPRAYQPVAVAPTTTASTEVKLDDSVYTRELQSYLWERMHEKAALWVGMSTRDMVANVVAQRRPNRTDGSVVLHLLFDKDVTPRGSVIYRAVSSATATVSTQVSYDEPALASMGYSVIDHKVQTVEDAPVGPLWNVLQYWAGDKQHRRWHMLRPIHASPRRNDCPAFMDAKMCAVQVWYEDDQRVVESLTALADLCESGLAGAAAPGQIRALMLG